MGRVVVSPPRVAGIGLVFLLLPALLGGSGCRQEPEGDGAQSPGPHPLAEPYLEVAFGNRWGPAPGVLRKWNRPVTVRVIGTPRYEDRIHLRRTIAEVASVPGMVDFDLAEWEPGRADLEVRYLTAELLREAGPDHEGYPALYRCRAAAGGALEHGEILLPADEAFPQYMRDNMLLEGLVACLGLAGGLEQHDDSAVHAEPNWYATSLTGLDRDLLALHYRDELPAGLSREAAARRLGLVR